MNQAKEYKYRADFGKRLAILRRNQGYTQERLADKADLTQQTVAAIEQGRRWASLTTLHQLAKALGTTTDTLFRDLRR